MALLTRRPRSGFILYPKDAEKRIVDGTARYRTKCDVLVGPCACGGVHQEDDEWVLDLLHDYGHTIPPFVLHVEVDGTVKMPRYWRKPRNHQHCNVVHGRCYCGQTHQANEQWTRDLLNAHHAIIENCSATSEPTIETETEVDLNETPVEGSISDCNCDSCVCHRREAQQQALDRKEI